jgi:hypothetical protein
LTIMRDEHHGTLALEWAADGDTGWALLQDGRAVARLAQGARGWVAETASGAWSLHRVGFHRPRLVVRPVESLAEVAYAQADWRGLVGLHFVSGPTWEIDPTHSGGTVVRDGTGAVVHRLAWNGRFDAPGLRVTSEPHAGDPRFAPLAGLVAGHLALERIGDPRQRLAYGVPLGATARTRWD